MIQSPEETSVDISTALDDAWSHVQTAREELVYCCTLIENTSLASKFQYIAREVHKLQIDFMTLAAVWDDVPEAKQVRLSYENRNETLEQKQP